MRIVSAVLFIVAASISTASAEGIAVFDRTGALALGGGAE